jgi:hypothetical protein
MHRALSLPEILSHIIHDVGTDPDRSDQHRPAALACTSRSLCDIQLRYIWAIPPLVTLADVVPEGALQLNTRHVYRFLS